MWTTVKTKLKTETEKYWHRVHTSILLLPPPLPLRRDNSCSSRLFTGNNCAWSTSDDTFDADNQGFIVRVAQDDCGSDNCPGVICEARITKPRADHVYTLNCGDGEGIVGSRVSIQLPGDNRMLNFVQLEVYGDAGRSFPHRCISTTGQGTRSCLFR